MAQYHYLGNSHFIFRGNKPIVEIMHNGKSVYNIVDACVKKVPIIAEHPTLVPIIAEHPTLVPIIAEHPTLVPIIADGITGGIAPEAYGSNPAVKVFGNENLIDAIDILSNTVVIDESHKVYAILNKSDHTKFADGTTWSGLYGNSFRHTPKIYYKPSLDADGFWQYEYSFLPLKGFEYSFEENFVGTYLAGFVNNALVSRPGVATKGNITMSQFWQYAQNVGSDYGLYDYHDWRKFVMMSYAKLKNRDAQTTVGFGLSNAGQNYYTATTGRTLSIGDGSGELQYDSTYKQVRVLGIEAPYGQVWQFLPGIRFSGNGATATVYDGNIVSNDAGGRTFLKPNNYSQAYITKMQLGEYFDLIPIAAGSGSANTYYCDATWASTSGELLFVGSRSGIVSEGGLAAANSHNPFSNTDPNRGARLAFKGDIAKYRLVSGEEMARLNG